MKILLADDHVLFRTGMEMIIKNVMPNTQVSTAENWTEVHNSVQKKQFDIALLDLFMPRSESWESELESFIAQDNNPPVCVVTASKLESHIKSVFDIGARGFLHKTSNIAEVREALTRIRQGECYISPSCKKNTGYKKKYDNKLTNRQREVLRLLTMGKSNKDIAGLLGIAESTVKRHVYDIFQSLGTNNRVQAGIIAKDQGVLLD